MHLVFFLLFLLASTAGTIKEGRSNSLKGFRFSTSDLHNYLSLIEPCSFPQIKFSNQITAVHVNVVSVSPRPGMRRLLMETLSQIQTGNMMICCGVTPLKGKAKRSRGRNYEGSSSPWRWRSWSKKNSSGHTARRWRQTKKVWNMEMRSGSPRTMMEVAKATQQSGLPPQLGGSLDQFLTPSCVKVTLGGTLNNKGVPSQCCHGGLDKRVGSSDWKECVMITRLLWQPIKGKKKQKKQKRFK